MLFISSFALDLLACLKMTSQNSDLFPECELYLPVNLVFPRLIQNKKCLDVKIHFLFITHGGGWIYFHLKNRSYCFSFGSCTYKELLLVPFMLQDAGKQKKSL